MKRVWGWVWRVVVVGVVALILYMLLIFIVFAWPAITAESRAKSFCEAAVRKNDVAEIRTMYFGDKPVDSAVWREDSDEIRIMAVGMFGLNGYECVIRLDENDKPQSQKVVFVDG